MRPGPVHAVRGPLTAERLAAQGIDGPPVHGDPALVMPWLYTPSTATRYPLGIVPHYADAADELLGACPLPRPPAGG